MRISNPEIIQFIWLLTNYHDDVDENGKFRPRVTYPRSHYKNTLSIKSKILGATEFYCKSDGAEPTIKAHKDLLPEDRIIGERITTGIDLDAGEINSIKHYYNERTELPIISEKSFADIEEMFK